MYWDLYLSLLCFVLGWIVCVFTMPPRTIVRRLKNIKEVAEDAYDGSVDSQDAIAFIMCEADLDVNTKNMKMKCKMNRSCKSK